MLFITKIYALKNKLPFIRLVNYFRVYRRNVLATLLPVILRKVANPPIKKSRN